MQLHLPLLLILSSRGILHTTAQLYTNFDALAAHHSLPTALLGKPNGLGLYPIKHVTCMARTPADLDAQQTNFVAESRDYFRAREGPTTSGYNPHYFCANVPKFSTGHDTATAAGEGFITPHSEFWMSEPTAWHWSPRSDVSTQKSARRLVFGKDKGLLFTVNVTGIRHGGRFLKGWFHLKISLALDHNIVGKRSFANGTIVPRLKIKYIIDKLMVTARGRILIPGKTYKKGITPGERGPPRRAWVGGIGQFVKDFPSCHEEGYNSPYVTQQFMPCGAVQYSESQYGNNFYYSRVMAGGDTKYGPNQAQGVQEIHLNFRLDNTFCNRYYDLDFIANGIVIDVDRNTNIPGPLPRSDKIEESHLKFTYVVQRSISTRFAFITSHPSHGPSYWENADPTPRGVDSVTCSHPLHGLDLMSPLNYFSSPPKTDEAHSCIPLSPEENLGPAPHTISVTQGAVLVPNPSATADASSSFGGSIKFIYPLPNSQTLINGDDTDFAARRTWTFSDIFRNKASEKTELFWKYWDDFREYPNSGQVKQNIAAAAIHAAVQRVLHEFDWETWRELGRANATILKVMSEQFRHFPEDARPPPLLTPWETPAFPIPNIALKKTSPGCGWCTPNLPDLIQDGFGGKNGKDVRNLGAQFWPHPYYDATCVGLDVATFKTTSRTVRNLVYTLERAQEKTSSEPNRWENMMPPILGRCLPELYWNPGIGKLDNAPPPCNQFFGDYGVKTLDPALKMVIQTTAGSARTTWLEEFGPDAKRHRTRFAFCAVVAKLKEEFPYCPSIPARPFTPTPPPHVVEKKAEDFKTTRAYNRGMMVAENPYSLYVYDSRVLHGLVMTIIVMFITPISIFLVRYFKETFMDSRVFLHRVWYIVHLGAAFLTPLLFIVAMWRLVEARAILGVSLSKTGKTHRFLGWVAIIIAVLLGLLGGFRCMNRTIRGIIIFLHFILGFAFYLISLGLIMVSVAIPGSPTATHDFSVIGTANHGEKRGAELWYLGREPIFLILTGWILFDLVMNIVMTMMQCFNDYEMKLTESRLCFGAGMPVLSENFRFDTPGRFFRIWALRLYILVSFGVTISICVLIILNSPRGHGFGFMSCTHTPDLEVGTDYGQDCLRPDPGEEEDG